MAGVRVSLQTLIINRVTKYQINKKDNGKNVTECRFGKTVFLAQAEAEQKLNVMKEKYVGYKERK